MAQASENLNNDAHPFPSPLTLKDASNLKVNDKADHCDIVGRFLLATITDKVGTNLKIHYDGWPKKWDIWCDFSKELHRFAAPKSISKRPAHRFKDLKEKDLIDIQPFTRFPAAGWKPGEISAFDEESGQIQVWYDQKGKRYLQWAHPDDPTKVAEFRSKSAEPNKKKVCSEKRKLDDNTDNRPAKKVKLSDPNRHAQMPRLMKLGHE